LISSGAAAVGLSLSRLSFAAPAEAAEAANGADYRNWEDLYREQWRWDKIVHSSHNCNCNNACSWKVYVKNGIVWREEQTAAYEQTVDGLADFNPQGCQKGASYSHEMYAPSRLRYPLKRVGERGSGKWKRISWDQALTEVATQLVEIVRDDGNDTIIAFNGTQGGAGVGRFVGLIGGVGIEPFGEIGDSFNGTIATTGHQCYDGGSDTRMYSKCIISWVYNPNATRIPDAHHINEARYNGATIISISPDQNPSHVHADLWINPKIGTDTALALAMANIIVRDKHYDEAHMKEQTDLPFLVREDTKKFLRASDLEADGSDDQFYVWDARTDRAVQPPGTMGSPSKTLRLGDIDPALEGQWEVRLRDGKTVTVRTVFERLKDMLAEHTPQFAQSVTGVGTEAIERLTREYATRKPALIQIGWGIGKLYHSDLLQRAIILLGALTGNIGTLGGGFWNGGILIGAALGGFGPLIPGQTGSRACPGAPWLYVHGGIREGIGSSWVPTPGEKSGDDYIMEAIEKFWMPVYPPPGKDPKCLIECGSNLLRRTRGNNHLLKHLWPKLKLVLTIDFNMSSSGMQSDYVLPAAGYYETEGIKYQDTKIPYLTIKSKAVDPVGESQNEYVIFAQLAKKISELAPGMGVKPYFDDVLGVERDLTQIYDEYTEGGEYTEDVDEREQVRRMMAGNSLFDGVTLEEFEEKGQMPWPNQGFKARGTMGPTSDYEPGKPYTPALDFVEGKEPWGTLTGRQQFYIDHEWFLEFGEELPVHREPPRMGGDYPLRMTCGHTRWGIHSWMRDNPLMLRLQRGEPIIYMNSLDAGARGIRDNDLVEMFNDISSAQVRVMVTPTMQPGQVHIYHAWEQFQFKDGKSHSGVYATQLKPLNMVGNYGHLYYTTGYYQPNNVDKGTTIEVRKL
jgi:DMSO reductase family type II enzyme molybdopterin subunit